MATNYVFNGVDMYATIPDWTPNGLPFEVSVEAVPLTVDAGPRFLYNARTTNANTLFNSVDVARSRVQFSNVSGGTTTVDVSGEVVLGQGYTSIAEFDASGSTHTISGSTLGEAIVAAPLSNSIDAIGANWVGTSNLFHGPIWNLRLTDNSPIQDTDICVGDGSRYVELQEPIVLEGDFEIEFDWIRQESLDSGGTCLFGDSASETIFIARNKTAGSTLEGFTVIGENTTACVFPTALEDIALGQHCTIKIVKSGDGTGAYEMFVDGVSKGTPDAASNISYTISTLGAYLNLPGRTLPTNSALQNIRITDLTNDRGWLYTLDEGSGTAALNTGKTQGNYANLPMYDTTVLEGNGTRYIEIPQFNLPASDEWRVSYDGIFANVNNEVILGDGTSDNRIYYTGGSSGVDPLSVSVTHGGSIAAFTDALTDGGVTAVGQHYSIIISHPAGGNACSCIVNGVTASVGRNITNDMTVSRLYGSNSFSSGAIQNVTLENLTTGEYVQYRIDEGSGTTVKAYDRSGNEIPASNGTITPDASWATIPEYSNDGEWTPDVDWQNVPDNSRWYPMESGAGQSGQLVCYDGNGNRAAHLDGTIVNYDERNWVLKNEQNQRGATSRNTIRKMSKKVIDPEAFEAPFME